MLSLQKKSFKNNLKNKRFYHHIKKVDDTLVFKNLEVKTQIAKSRGV